MCVCVCVCVRVCVCVFRVSVSVCAHIAEAQNYPCSLGNRSFQTRVLVHYLYHVEQSHNCDLTIVLKNSCQSKPLNQIGIFWYQFTPRELLYLMISVNLVHIGCPFFGATLYMKSLIPKGKKRKDPSPCSRSHDSGHTTLLSTYVLCQTSSNCH